MKIIAGSGFKNVGVCSSDIQRSFDNGAYFYPLVMGHEIAGEIIEIGKNIKMNSISDRVAIFSSSSLF